MSGEKEKANRYQELFQDYRRVKEWLAKVREMEGSFKPKVVKKVVSDYQERCEKLRGELLPIEAELREELERQKTDREVLTREKEALEEEKEEIQIRSLIGEMGEDEKKESLGKIEYSIQSLCERIQAIDREIGYYEEILAQSEEERKEEVTRLPEAESTTGDLGLELERVALEIGKEIGLGETPFSESHPFEGAELEVDESPAFRKPFLIFKEGTPEEWRFAFDGEVLSIGRARENDIQITDDPKVSRFHCRLFKREKEYFVEDNKSSNGVIVNGRLMMESRLQEGDQIRIGDTVFRFATE